MPDPFLSVIVPAYNEERTVGELLKGVLATPHDKEVIIVDDGSTDRTPEVLRGFQDDPRVKILRNDRNRGKGASVSRAISQCRGEIVLIQDADLEYDPTDYDRLPLPCRAAKGAPLLALDRQLDGDDLFQHAHRPQPGRYGDRLQGLQA